MKHPVGLTRVMHILITEHSFQHVVLNYILLLESFLTRKQIAKDVFLAQNSTASNYVCTTHFPFNIMGVEFLIEQYTIIPLKKTNKNKENSGHQKRLL